MVPREFITFEKPVRKQDSTGQKVPSWEPVLADVPAERRKQQPKPGSEMNAREEFVEVQLTFWVRYLEEITADMRISYNGEHYRILDLKRQFWDNSLLITCSKNNA